MAEVQDRPLLLYVFDPLCGWCYGFHPVIEQLQEKYQDQFAFQVISGGMVRGERIGPIGEVAGYISEAYKVVEEKTGVTFGEGFLRNVLAPGTTIFDSEPPARALAVLKQHAPDQQVALSSAVQKAIYYDGMEPVKPESYAGIASEFGLDPALLAEQMNTEAAQRAAEAEFDLSNQLGVQGFPTVFLFTQTHRFLLARGYLPFAQMEDTIGQALAYMQS